MDKKRSALDGLLGKLDTQISAETTTPSRKPHLTSPLRPPKLDPLSMLPKVSKARHKRTAMRKAKQSKVIKIPNNDEIDDGSNNDLKDVDESKFKTMDWIEPDGSKTKLRFDDDGTLIGKDKK